MTPVIHRDILIPIIGESLRKGVTLQKGFSVNIFLLILKKKIIIVRMGTGNGDVIWPHFFEALVQQLMIRICQSDLISFINSGSGYHSFSFATSCGKVKYFTVATVHNSLSGPYNFTSTMAMFLFISTSGPLILSVPCLREQPFYILLPVVKSLHWFLALQKQPSWQFHP